MYTEGLEYFSEEIKLNSSVLYISSFWELKVIALQLPYKIRVFLPQAMPKTMPEPHLISSSNVTASGLSWNFGNSFLILLLIYDTKTYL